MCQGKKRLVMHENERREKETIDKGACEREKEREKEKERGPMV